MAGTAKVSIWNLALGMIGQRPISSDTEQSVMALACARAWDPARREVLRECPWGFATVIESLSSLANFTPPLGWFYAYAYPAKCLAIRKVFPPIEGITPTGGAIFLNQSLTMPAGANQLATPIRQTTGDKFREVLDRTNNVKVLLSNTQDAVIEYTYDLEDTTLYDASCVTLLGYRLAADIATPLTGDSSIAVNLMKIYNVRLSEAQRLNASEDNTRALGDAGTVDAR